ncbi:MAG: hypothetical protein DRP66_05045 [Planctomycetota bacterium]|nr:MAG: hypothetical protein DRP66_05045 [Planctomycetota bacterium]
MKKIIITFICFVFISCAYCGQQDPVSEVQTLLEQKEYSKVTGMLNRILRAGALSPSQRAEALKIQAHFYEELMGNPDGALRLYKKILDIKLPEDHPARSMANNEISRLNALKEKYSKQDLLLKQSRIASSRGTDKNKIKRQIAQLHALIEENPEYYKLAEAYYYLGVHYMSLEKYRQSCKLFEKCVQIKPCINFHLAVEVRARVSQTRWAVITISKTAWAIIGVLLVFTVVGFYVSRPWRRLKIRHLAIGLLMVILWWAIFTGSHKYFGEIFQADETIINTLGAQEPWFVNAAPTSPGAEVAKHLFLYGLVATLEMFVFSIGTSRLKCIWTTILINAIFGLLLFSSLTAVFYMRYCDQQGAFRAKGKNIISLANGHIYFIQGEMEPMILTNPKAYPNLSTKVMRDLDLREWLEQHCPSDPKTKKNLPEK